MLRPPEIHYDGGVLSSAELERRVQYAAAILRARKIQVVGLCLPNSRQCIAAILGCIQARVLVCLLSPRLPSSVVTDYLHQAGAHMVITDREDLDLECLHPDDLFVETYSDNEDWAGDNFLATIVYTSGSANHPKAAVHRLRHHLANAQGVMERFQIGPQDRWLLSLPLYHVSGLSIVFRCALARATLVLSEMPLYDALVEHKATHTSLVSTQLLRLLEQSADGPIPPSLKAMIVGGGPVPRHALETARQRGWPVCTTYGLTEMGSMVTVSDPRVHLDTAGGVLTGRALAFAPDGELLVQGDSLFAGYLVDGNIREAVDKDGWFHTRDIGRLDSNKNLVVLGRKDSMFISGGENIHPEEIERALCDLPGVTRAVVVPVPDAAFGARPVAFVQGGANASTLEALLARVLPKYMIPEIRSWPESVPQSGIKVPRRYFAELAGVKP